MGHVLWVLVLIVRGKFGITMVNLINGFWIDVSNQNIFLSGVQSSNPTLCIYYSIFLSTEVNSRGQSN